MRAGIGEELQIISLLLCNTEKRKAEKKRLVCYMLRKLSDNFGGSSYVIIRITM